MSNLLLPITIGIILGVIAGAISLALEYRTGIFQQAIEVAEVVVTVIVQRIDPPDTQTPTPVPLTCSVPDLVELDQSAANVSIAALGLRSIITNEYSDSIPAGAVISQEPLLIFPRKSGHEDKLQAKIVYNTTLEGTK